MSMQEWKQENLESLREEIKDILECTYGVEFLSSDVLELVPSPNAQWVMAVVRTSPISNRPYDEIKACVKQCLWFLDMAKWKTYKEACKAGDETNAVSTKELIALEETLFEWCSVDHGLSFTWEMPFHGCLVLDIHKTVAVVPEHVHKDQNKLVKAQFLYATYCPRCQQHHPLNLYDCCLRARVLHPQWVGHMCLASDKPKWKTVFYKWLDPVLKERGVIDMVLDFWFVTVHDMENLYCTTTADEYKDNGSTGSDTDDSDSDCNQDDDKAKDESISDQTRTD
jgi:hypothetical protein